MAAQPKPQLDLTAEELDQMADRARVRGFSTVTAYVRELFKEDVEHPIPADDDDEYVYESFREGMTQALRGEGRPAREVLAELEDDEDA